eukprot:scaffold935_cov155-Amphora_coffeaeformis.AAC.2
MSTFRTLRCRSKEGVACFLWTFSSPQRPKTQGRYGIVRCIGRMKAFFLSFFSVDPQISKHGAKGRRTGTPVSPPAKF